MSQENKGEGMNIMIKMRRAMLKIAIGMGLCVTLAACGTGSSSSARTNAAEPSKVTTVRVIYQPSGLSSYFFANAKNLWAKYGLKIQPISVEAGQNELAPLVGGSADFAFLGGPPTITAIAKQIPVKVIFSTNNVSHLEGLIVTAKSGITRLSQIAGAQIAVPTGSSAWAGMHLVLAKAGIPFSSVHTVNLQPSAALSAFEAGSIQGAWIWDTWIERMKSLGGHVVALEHSYGVAEPNSWVVSDSFLAAHPGTVEKFLAALNAGANGANSDPAVAAPEYASLTGVTVPEAIAIMKAEPTFTFSTALSQTGSLSFTNPTTGFANTLYKSGQVLASAGIIAAAPSVSEIANAIDIKIVKEANSRYG